MSVSYNSTGEASSEELNAYWMEIRATAPVSHHPFPIFLAGLGEPNLAADFKYWSRMEWIKLDEVLWSAIGLDPRRGWLEKLKDHHKQKPDLRPELDQVESQLEQL